VPVRWVVVGFAATPYDTDPLPVPFPPAVMVIQGTELVAVHVHPVAALTFTTRNAVVADSVTLVVESEMAQTGAACVTVKTRPPIVSVAVLEAFDVLAAIAY
jgi:hypothetical protein